MFKVGDLARVVEGHAYYYTGEGSVGVVEDVVETSAGQLITASWYILRGAARWSETTPWSFTVRAADCERIQPNQLSKRDRARLVRRLIAAAID